MATCNQCGGPFAVGPSVFPGFDLLACRDCGRALRLISTKMPDVTRHRLKRGDEQRVLRAARRQRMRQGR